jgi:hypothetical protein
LTLRVNQSAVDSACVLQHINYLLFFVVIGPVELVGNALALSTNPQAFLFIANTQPADKSLAADTRQSKRLPRRRPATIIASLGRLVSS